MPCKLRCDKLSEGLTLVIWLNMKFIFMDLLDLIVDLCLLITGLRGSLSRLQLDYVDIVFANRNDVNSPMEGPFERFQIIIPA